MSGLRKFARRGVRRLLLHLGRLLPRSVWRRLVHLWLDLVGFREPEDALRSLLHFESLLTRHLDRAALRYGDGVHPKHRLMRYHDFFVDRLEAGERVLDVGCGIGAVAYSMATRAAARVTAVDLDPVNIAAAQRHHGHPRIEYLLQDVIDAPPDGPFDAIVASNVLEHFAHRVEFLRTTQERLEPRRWLIRVPMTNRSWLVPLRADLGLPHFNDPDHHIEYTRASFEAEMAAAGLAVVHLETGWGEIWAEVVPTTGGD